LFPVVTFLKCVVTEVSLFAVVPFKTLPFHKVGVVGSLVICYYKLSPDSVSEIIFFENRLIFGKVIAYKYGANCFEPPCSIGFQCNLYINKVKLSVCCVLIKYISFHLENAKMHNFVSNCGLCGY